MNRAAKIALLKKEYEQNSIGEWIETYTKTNVFAYVESISMNEFYQAGQQGFKPEFRFLTWATEYAGEEDLEYNEKVYTIYRTYSRDDGRVELYVTLKKGDEE